jgi:hypothetical protein
MLGCMLKLLVVLALRHVLVGAIDIDAENLKRPRHFLYKKPIHLLPGTHLDAVIVLTNAEN